MELGVVVTCPGEERLVKVVLTVGDAVDAGDFHAHELQRGQLVDGRECKRRRGLLEQVMAALQRAAGGAGASERYGLGGARRYGLVAAALAQVVANFGRHAAQRGDDGYGVGAGGVDRDVARVVHSGYCAGRSLAARVLGHPIRNAKGCDRRLLVTLPTFALAQHQVDVGRAGVGAINAGQPRGKGLGVDAVGHVSGLLDPVPLGAQGLGLVFVQKGNIELGAHGGSFVRLAVHVLQGYPSGGRSMHVAGICRVCAGGRWCVLSLRGDGGHGVRSLDGCFGRPRSRGAFWRGGAVKQMGKQMVSFWSVERQPCQKLDGFAARRRRMNILDALRLKTAGRLPKT